MGYVRWAEIRGRHLGLDLSDSVVWQPGVGSCWVCGEPADYADLTFMAPVCGGICEWAGWEAMRLHDTPWRAW